MKQIKKIIEQTGQKNEIKVIHLKGNRLTEDSILTLSQIIGNILNSILSKFERIGS